MDNHVYILMGSNHRPAANLRLGVRALAEIGEVQAVSSVYQSPPAGADESDGPHPDSYLNAAVLLVTSLNPEALKARLRAIEDRCGRERQDARGRKSRSVTLDLDIVLFNRDRLDIAGSPVPDPDILRHGHVAVPLAEIAPDFIHPETGTTLREIARQFLATPGLVRLPNIDLWTALQG